MNVDCRAISVEDAYEQALELKSKLREFAKGHGVGDRGCEI
jgi:hypothetical protein